MEEIKKPVSRRNVLRAGQLAAIGVMAAPWIHARAQGTKVIRLAHHVSLQSEQHKAAENFAALVQRFSNGALSVRVLPAAQAGGQREALFELEQRLALKEGELMAALQQLAALSDARAELAELHASLDEQRAAVRRAQQQARDHEAIAGEYEKKLKGLRDALGKAELDRQRKESDHQRALLEASKKLRSQKQLSDSLQRALQYEQQQQQQAGPGIRGVRAVGPPASGVFGRSGPSFSFGR